MKNIGARKQGVSSRACLHKLSAKPWIPPGAGNTRIESRDIIFIAPDLATPLIAICCQLYITTRSSAQGSAE